MSLGSTNRQEGPNHALQRTAPCVTAPASAAAFPPTMQVPRRTPRSLSLGSFSPSRSEGENPGAEPVPLFSATLRENQGHETDRSAAV